MLNSETYSKGGKPSVVRSFEITNLHGYRTISLESPYAATILIAQNGAGKTTLLNALDAFLKGQFLRLKDLNFSEIRCRLGDQDEAIVVKFEDIQNFAEQSTSEEIATFAKRIQIEPRLLATFLCNNFGSLDAREITHGSEDPVIDSAFRTFDYDRAATLDQFEKLQNLLLSRNPIIQHAITAVKSAIKGFEILYLPTYRRIESPLLPTKEDDRHYRRNRARFKIPFSMFSGDIQFGLSDISERLVELNQEIIFKSNRGYRTLSADIIKELLDGSFDKSDVDDFYLPTSEDLKMFFMRLKELRHLSPYEVVIPDINQLLNLTSIPSQTNRFLLYFISKLNSVIQATKGIEGEVEQFISKCNKYLGNSDLGYTPENHVISPQQDYKELRLDRTNLSVYAVSLPSERKITLDALSSGEKQMISLLAKLYLYPKSKIILIDEPELSLSIDWQRQILDDVINAPTCVQLVAITHSPFVFDNPLQDFAKSLKVTIDQDRIPGAIDADDLDGDLS